MKRAWALVTACVLAMVIGMLFLPQAQGQDLSDDRLAALETQVADLSTRVAALESGSPSNEDPAAVIGEANTIVFEGFGGKETTEITQLSGVYRLAATCADGFFFNIDTTNLDNPDNFEYINLAGEIPFNGETIYTFEPARYVFAIDCAGPWTFTLEPIG